MFAVRYTYFALEYAEGDCALWRIDGPWALKSSISIQLAEGRDNAGALGVPYNEGEDRAFAEYILNPSTPLFACPQTPFMLNERLRTQMGVFVAPGRIDASFEDNLKALREYEKPDHVLEIVIPSEMRNSALEQLFDIGVSRRSLFPGLDGYAQSLAVYSPAFNPVKWL